MVLTGASSKFGSLVRRLDKLAPGLLKAPTPVISSRVTRQKQRRLGDAQTLELVSSYRAGVAIHELAKTYGVHRHSVTAHLAKAGVERRPKGLLPVQVDEAVRLYLAGSSLVKIAELLACDPETVRRVLRLADVQLRKAWERP